MIWKRHFIIYQIITSFHSRLNSEKIINYQAKMVAKEKQDRFNSKKALPFYARDPVNWEKMDNYESTQR